MVVKKSSSSRKYQLHKKFANYSIKRSSDTLHIDFPDFPPEFAERWERIFLGNMPTFNMDYAKVNIYLIGLEENIKSINGIIDNRMKVPKELIQSMKNNYKISKGIINREEINKISSELDDLLNNLQIQEWLNLHPTEMTKYKNDVKLFNDRIERINKILDDYIHTDRRISREEYGD